MSAQAPARARWLRRLGWLVLIWSASVVALALVALALRVLMTLAGLKA
jgi:hypothetical protein